MGILVYSLLWVMQDFYHQTFHKPTALQVGMAITASATLGLGFKDALT